MSDTPQPPAGGAGANGVIMLSGDRHSAALYRKDGVVDYPLYEATSSSLNLPGAIWRARSGDTYMEPGPNRLGDMFYEANYGVVDIDWAADRVTLSIRDENGVSVRRQAVGFRSLR